MSDHDPAGRMPIASGGGLREPPLRQRLAALRTPNREPHEQRVRPAFRVASGLLSLFCLMGIVAFDGNDPLELAGFGFAVLAFGWIAVRGWNQPVIDPDASERFRELADPARPLDP